MNLSHLSTNRRNIVERALNNGFTAIMSPDKTIQLRKGTTSKSTSVIIRENGVMTRGGIRLDLAASMSIQDVENYLFNR